MRIIIQDAEQQFSHIADTMRHDPTSWEKWFVLYINIQENKTQKNTLPASAYIANYIGHQMKELDGVAYLNSEQHVFILCRDIEAYRLRTMGYDMADALFEQHNLSSYCTLYEPTYAWQYLQSLCETPDGVDYFPFPCDHSMGRLRHTLGTMQDVLSSNMIERKSRFAMRILLVEDDPLTRKIVARCMKNNQHLITANNARDAVTQYALHAPDIVFLDIGLPDHSGFHVMDAIRTYDDSAYIIMFSANSFVDNVVTSLQAGANGFVAKPFRKEQLFHYVSDYQKYRSKYVS